MAVSTDNRNNRLLSDINVTPFVDVMLVLLIIFMVTAPLIRHGVDVDLPKASAKHIAAPEETLTLTVTQDKKIFLNTLPIEQSELQSRLVEIFKQRTDSRLNLKADKSLPYGYVAHIMADIKNAGIQRLGIITTPVEKK